VVTNSFAGAAYVFTRSVGSWSQQAYVKASNTEASDVLAPEVALAAEGNALAVGAPGEDRSLAGVTAGSVNEAASGDGASGSGAVYVYNRSAGTWTQSAYVKASNTGAGDQCGAAVILSGDGN